MSKRIKYDNREYLFDSIGDYMWLKEIDDNGNLQSNPNRFDTPSEMMDYIYGKNKPSRRVPETVLQLHRPD